MRRYGLVAGVMLLLAGFTVAWFILPSDDPNPTQTSALEDSLAALPDDQPLASDNKATPAHDPLSPPTQSSVKAETGAQGGTTAETRPDRSRIETTPGTKPNVQNPSETHQAAGPSQDGAESTGAGETPAVRPFIKDYPRPKGQNLGNTRPAARRISKPAGVKELSDVTPKLRQDRRGLYAQYFHTDGPIVSKLDTSTPGMVRIDRQVYFPNEESFADLPISRDNFAAVWTGFLVIPAQGDYWLFWGADNGGRVELDGETVLLQDGMVRYVEVSTVLTLQPGLHPLRIEFAQQHNSVADWAKCAANFMYVPEGQSKPIPVPPEMLMVPEWMWSDKAPIITSLSKTSGEIGDEITIKGQSLYTEREMMYPGPNALSPHQKYPDLTHVYFAGQLAEILERSETELKVRVPIGAKTGDVMVTKAPAAGFIGSLGGWQVVEWGSSVPSNSAEFAVTTQFGLMAQWYDLDGWSNYGFIDSAEKPPDLTRMESNFNFFGRDHLDFEFAVHPLAAHWEGKLGLPADFIPEDKVTQIQFETYGRIRVTLGDETKESLPENPEWSQLRYVRFELSGGEERYLKLSIDMTDAAGFASLRAVILENVGYEWPNENEKGAEVWEELDLIPHHWFFPPVVPPKPPKISNVKAVWVEGEQPPVQPYDADPSRPSVRVGQEFSFDITDYGPAKIWDSQPTVTIDGIPLAYTVDGELVFGDQSERTLHCRATMPDGVGEGKLIARISIVSSEPFLIDITNRGLVAYLYDIPEASGLDELPELQPLTCFKVRKDRTINFEDTVDFDLPFPAETFVIEWLGGLIIEQEGEYEFICRSDDGTKLWLDDNVVIDANHRQAPAENKATVHLVPGVYRFRMQFFENNQHEVCVLEWRATQGEGESQTEIIPREVVPANAFSLDTHPPFPAKTSTGKRTDGS